MRSHNFLTQNPLTHSVFVAEFEEGINFPINQRGIVTQNLEFITTQNNEILLTQG